MKNNIFYLIKYMNYLEILPPNIHEKIAKNLYNFLDTFEVFIEVINYDYYSIIFEKYIIEPIEIQPFLQTPYEKYFKIHKYVKINEIYVGININIKNFKVFILDQNSVYFRDNNNKIKIIGLSQKAKKELLNHIKQNLATCSICEKEENFLINIGSNDYCSCGKLLNFFHEKCIKECIICENCFCNNGKCIKECETCGVVYICNNNDCSQKGNCVICQIYINDDNH